MNMNAANATLIKLLFLLVITFTLPLDTLAQAGGKKNGPPPWAPAHGYRAKTRHVYFAEHNFYFDVKNGVYIYASGDKWQVGVKLPSIFARVDLNKAVKVELELNTDSPQKYNAEHKTKYKSKTKSGKGKSNNGRGKSKKGRKGKGKKK